MYFGVSAHALVSPFRPCLSRLSESTRWTRPTRCAAGLCRYVAQSLRTMRASAVLTPTPLRETVRQCSRAAIFPTSLTLLLASFRPLFTAPSFATFSALVGGFVAQTGEHN